MAAPRSWIAPTGVRIPSWTCGGLIDDPDVDTRRAYEVDMAVLPLAIEMETTGLPINLDSFREIEADKRPEWERLWGELQAHVPGIPDRVVEGVGDEQNTCFGPMPGAFNPKSPSQLGYVLYDPNGPCKLSAPKKTDTGQPSTDKDALAKLAEHPFVQTLLAWREIDYVFTTYIYGSALVVRGDGRVHPSWNTTGARTGRWSSSPNFQNWPVWLRRAIEAPEGWVIVGADYSQLELRIMAALCGDPNLIERCKNADEGRKLEPEWDPHSFVASHFFGESFTGLALDDPDTKAARKALREVIKSCIYGMNYGAGAAKVLEAIYKKGYQGMPLNRQLVQQAINKIFELFPGVKRWREETLEWSTTHGQVRSGLLNRWRYFPWNDVQATVAWNYPIQSTGADIINLRLIELAQRRERQHPDVQLMAQVHDALYTLAPEDEAEDVAKLITDAMSVELRLHEDAPLMPFNATAKIGRTWDTVS